MRNLNLFKHLRTKLTVLYVALFVAVLSLISAAVYVATTRNVEQMVRQQLVASSAVFANLSATRNTRLREEADILAHDFGFRDAVASSDQPTIRSALSNISRRFGVDLAFVITVDGRVVARAGRPAVLPPEVVRAVAAETATSGAFAVKGVAYEAVAAPIMAPDLTGWVVFGSALGPQAMSSLTRLSAIPLQAVVLSRSKGGWALVGSGKPVDPSLQALIGRSTGAQAVQTGDLSGPGGPSIALVQMLPRFGEAQAIGVLMTCPLAQALKPYEALGVTILLFGLLGVGLVVAGSWLLARTLTQPISALETAAKRLQRGETARVVVRSGDEIASLGVSFNAMADDIEDREASLRKAKEVAETANRAKSIFLTNMNHEVRTPLNGVLGVAGMLATTPLDADQRQMVDLIESSGVALQRILNDVLDMVDLGSDQLDLVHQPFDLGRLVRSLSGAASAKAESKYLPLRLTLDPAADQWVCGDAVRVEQILSNLLDNAVKFTDVGQIDVGVAVQGDAYRFEIKDTGLGFDPTRIEDLFSPFSQADGSMTRQAGGTGLGLSLARDIARAMGGDIVGDGAPGRGAVFTFTVRLPSTAAPRILAASAFDFEAEDAWADDLAEPPPIRVLLAEDNPANRLVIEMILTGVDVDLLSVENGALAVEACRHKAFDVILMDLQMPVMDGLEAIRLIREHEAATRAAPTPIVVISANVQSAHLRASALAGADSHLAKPIVASTLIATLEEVLANRKRVAQPALAAV